MEEPPKQRLRFPRARWLFPAAVLLVVAGVALSLWLPYRYEESVKREIMAAGGYFDVELVMPLYFKWAFGDDPPEFFYHVYKVNADGRPIDDAFLERICGLPSVDELQLHETAVTDAGMVSL